MWDYSTIAEILEQTEYWPDNATWRLVKMVAPGHGAQPLFHSRRRVVKEGIGEALLAFARSAPTGIGDISVAVACLP